MGHFRQYALVGTLVDHASTSEMERGCVLIYSSHAQAMNVNSSVRQLKSGVSKIVIPNEETCLVCSCQGEILLLRVEVKGMQVNLNHITVVSEEDLRIPSIVKFVPMNNSDAIIFIMRGVDAMVLSIEGKLINRISLPGSVVSALFDEKSRMMHIVCAAHGITSYKQGADLSLRRLTGVPDTLGTYLCSCLSSSLPGQESGEMAKKDALVHVKVASLSQSLLGSLYTLAY